MSSFINRFKKKRSDSQLSSSSAGNQNQQISASQSNSSLNNVRSLLNLGGSKANSQSKTRNQQSDIKATYGNSSHGGSGAIASTDNIQNANANQGNNHQQQFRRKNNRASSMNSAYRDPSSDGGRQSVGQVQLNQNVDQVEVSKDDFLDLQTTVLINKEVVKSLIEAQQATSPNHKALKASLSKLNEENQILLKQVAGGVQTVMKGKGDDINVVQNAQILVIDKETNNQDQLLNLARQDSSNLATQKQGDQIKSLRKWCSDLHLKVKQKDACLTKCASKFLEMSQIAHYVCKKDVGTKLRLEQLTRHYKIAMVKEIENGRSAPQMKDINKYTGASTLNQVGNRPVVNRQSQQSESDSDSGSEESSSDDDDNDSNNDPVREQRFINIRDIDVNSEVLDLHGQLKIAMLEIKRLREQLTLIGVPAEQMSQPRVAQLSMTSVQKSQLSAAPPRGSPMANHNDTSVDKIQSPLGSSMFEKDRGSVAVSEASFGGQPAKESQQARTEIKLASKPKEEVKLKGRENFKLQLNEETKLNLGKVVANQTSGLKATNNVPTLNFNALNKTPSMEHEDYRQYSLKLEESMKFMRQRTQHFEADNLNLSKKYITEKQHKDEALVVNQKLAGALQTCKVRMQQIKDKYKSRVAKMCSNCGHQIAAGSSNNRHTKSSVSDMNSAIDLNEYDDIIHQAKKVNKAGGSDNQRVVSEYTDGVASSSKRRNYSSGSQVIQQSNIVGTGMNRVDNLKKQRRPPVTMSEDHQQQF